MVKGNVALACALGILVMLPVSADETKVNLAADDGLWEVTTHPQTTGEMPISQEQLQRLTPEQRARVEAAMKAAMGAANREHVMHECMTPEKRQKGFDLGDEGSSCKTKVIKNTNNELEVRRECSTDNDVHTTTEHIRMNGRRHVSGTVDAAMSRGEKQMTMHMSIEGKWLGADCGAVKDSEVVK
jgi:hypothetical protein